MADTRYQRTAAQKLAALDAKRARLIEQVRKDEDGKKYVLGGWLMRTALEDVDIRSLVLKRRNEIASRDQDQKRLVDFFAELESKAAGKKSEKTSV